MGTSTSISCNAGVLISARHAGLLAMRRSASIHRGVEACHRNRNQRRPRFHPCTLIPAAARSLGDLVGGWAWDRSVAACCGGDGNSLPMGGQGLCRSSPCRDAGPAGDDDDARSGMAEWTAAPWQPQRAHARHEFSSCGVQRRDKTCRASGSFWHAGGMVNESRRLQRTYHVVYWRSLSLNFQAASSEILCTTSTPNCSTIKAGN